MSMFKNKKGVICKTSPPSPLVEKTCSLLWVFYPSELRIGVTGFWFTQAVMRFTLVAVCPCQGTSQAVWQSIC